jgi:hypothetical protein
MNTFSIHDNERFAAAQRDFDNQQDDDTEKDFIESLKDETQYHGE